MTVQLTGLNPKERSGATKILRNLVVPPNFVSINGKDFGEVVASKMVNYGKEWQGINFADAQDPYYNPEKAKAKFNEAKKELQAKGVQFPIHLDMTVDLAIKKRIQEVNSMKQSIEAVLGAENIVIDVQQLTTEDMTIQAIWLRQQLRRIMIFTMVVGLQTIKILQPILTSLTLILVV